MKFLVDGKERTVTLQKWDGTEWGEDIFAETAADLSEKFDKAPNGDSYVGGQEDFAMLIEFWRAEIGEMEMTGKGKFKFEVV